jgi:heptosyltransferase-3
MVFLGPEERDCLGYFQRELAGALPVVFEPDVRKFAALVANCDLFVACDGGPVHLACALRVRTLALFIASDAHRWGPPPELGRVVVDPDLDVTTAFAACLEELDERLSEKRRQIRHDVFAGRQAPENSDDFKETHLLRRTL